MLDAITIRTPGKLMVAGEFAVLERNETLLVMAINKYVETTIRSAQENSVTFSDFQLEHIGWHEERGEIIFHQSDSRFQFVQKAMEVTFTYIKRHGMTVTPCALSIKSNLDDEATGAKYGLGSSAAVVTSVVHALLTFFLREKAKDEVIFKLASIAHIAVQGNGSGADIAASTYGGLLRYTSFQADWLLEKLQQYDDVTELVDITWDYLTVERVQFPQNMHIYVGWTGAPASTKNLVTEISQLKETNRVAYDSFIHASRCAVQTIVFALENDDVQQFFTGIRKNRKALATLGRDANVNLETDKLRFLSDSAERLSGAGKFSGAGGGDCGLAFLPVHVDGNKLLDTWEEAGIKALDVQLDTRGSTAYKNE
ncbi:MAG TPA: phosphomevalonate kinase [Pseudogracilibacillus sp.]|nr:phosphomevalonate kinase [Pseudogracilibacillus sp.]